MVCTNCYLWYFIHIFFIDPGITITKPKVKILKPSKKEACEKAVTLVCLAEDFYPDHVTIKWKIGTTEVVKGVATDQYATQNYDKMFQMSSRLKVKKKEWNNAKKKFTCIVTFYNHTYTEEIATVNGVVGMYSLQCEIYNVYNVCNMYTMHDL